MSRVWLVIGGMAVATYLTRAPMFLALGRWPLPPRVRLWLRLVPLAVLPALAVPLVLVRDGRLALGLAHPPPWRAAVVVVPAAPRVNLFARGAGRAVRHEARRRALRPDVLRIRRRFRRAARRRASRLRGGLEHPDEGARVGTARRLPRAVDAVRPLRRPRRRPVPVSRPA